MMKVFLVDDEQLSLDYITSLIEWNRYGFELIGTATNGSDALRVMQQNHPHIVITDIRMPVMDGLALIKKVNQLNDNTVFIVVSAYNDFEYAQQAINLGGVTTYLIKHTMNKETLLQQLNKAKNIWHENQTKLQLFKNNQMQQFFLRSEQLVPSYPWNSQDYLGLFLCQQNQPFKLLHDQQPLDPSIFRTFSAEQHIVALHDSSEVEFIGEFWNSEHQLVVAILIKKKSLYEKNMFHQKIASEFLNIIAERHAKNCSILYGTVYASQEHLLQAYDRLLDAAMHGLFFGTNTIIDISKLSLTKEHRSLDISASAILEHLYANQLDSLQQLIHSSFERLTVPEWNLYGLRKLIEVLVKSYKKFKKIDELPSHFYAQSFFHISEIRDFFIDLLTNLTEEKHLILSNKMQKALAYIHHHYALDLSIHDVADHIKVSASYLHLLFKKELNYSFLQYLTDYRIKVAQNMLASQNYKISEVASKVGFRTPHYFGIKFKQVTGMLPKQFKEGGY